MNICGKGPRRLLESYFSNHGRIVSKHPWKVIASCLVVFSLFSVLLYFNFHWETNVIKLWIPSGSDFALNYDRLWSSDSPPEMRMHAMIFQSEENVLKPEYLAQIARIRRNLEEIRVDEGKTWNDFCFR